MIETHSLRRTFASRSGPVEAVAGVDLSVAAGEIFGFLGPNGAGKTTTLRMLATLLPPDGGEALVAGVDLRRADAALAAFQLTEFARRRCKTYSGGQRRRVDIALGVIHRPSVVFLDEP